MENANNSKNPEWEKIKPLRKELELFVTTHRRIVATDAKEEWLIDQALQFAAEAAQHNEKSRLIICPPNEFNVKKLLSSYLVPIQTCYRELYYLQCCALFVAGHLDYEPLEPTNSFPKFFSTPFSTLISQAGNCFEFSQVLVSLLLGAGYDAYCVCGEINFSALRRVDSPAQFIHKIMDDNESSLHCWVLVRKNARHMLDVLIEPTTGTVFACDEYPYTTVFFIWNHQNYWVNRQASADDTTAYSFELEEEESFVAFVKASEKVAFTPGIPRCLNLNEKTREMFSPWFPKPRITAVNFKTRYVNGCQIEHKDGMQIKKFSRSAQPDGLVQHATNCFGEASAQDPVEIEIYADRHDYLVERKKFSQCSFVETFAFGRSDVLYQRVMTDVKRELRFFPYRLDGLSSYVEVKGTKFKEYFIDREDRLIYRAVTFTKFKPLQEKQNQHGKEKKEIVKLTKKFSYTPNESYQEIELKRQVRKITFHVAERQIRISFFHSAGCILVPSVLLQQVGAHLEVVDDYSSTKRNLPAFSLSESEVGQLLNQQTISLMEAEKMLKEGPSELFSARDNEERLIKEQQYVYKIELNKEKIEGSQVAKKREEAGVEDIKEMLNIETNCKNKNFADSLKNPMLERHYLLSNKTGQLDLKTVVSIVGNCKEEIKSQMLEKETNLQMHQTELTEHSPGVPSFRRRNSSVPTGSNRSFELNCFKQKVLKERIVQNEMEAIRRFAELDRAIADDKRFALYFSEL